MVFEYAPFAALPVRAGTSISFPNRRHGSCLRRVDCFCCRVVDGPREREPIAGQEDFR